VQQVVIEPTTDEALNAFIDWAAETLFYKSEWRAKNRPEKVSGLSLAKRQNLLPSAALGSRTDEPPRQQNRLRAISGSPCACCAPAALAAL
jgi:hypothetical protein